MGRCVHLHFIALEVRNMIKTTALAQGLLNMPAARCRVHGFLLSSTLPRCRTILRDELTDLRVNPFMGLDTLGSL